MKNLKNQKSKKYISFQASMRLTGGCLENPDYFFNSTINLFLYTYGFLLQPISPPGWIKMPSYFFLISTALWPNPDTVSDSNFEALGANEERGNTEKQKHLMRVTCRFCTFLQDRRARRTHLHCADVFIQWLEGGRGSDSLQFLLPLAGPRGERCRFAAEALPPRAHHLQLDGAAGR